MDDLHQTRHQLRNKGASKILSRANNSRSTEAEASTEVQHYKFYIQPTVKTSDITPDVDVYINSDWAGCATTRKSTSGFVIKFMGAAIHFASRAQSTIALSSAEAELYAINTGATEALHIRSFLTEVLNTKKVNMRIYTDSSSAKSMATRIGSSKKAKHRVETSLYPTIGAQRRRANPQDQHGGKSGRHLHQVRFNRDALAASQ